MTRKGATGRKAKRKKSTSDADKLSPPPSINRHELSDLLRQCTNTDGNSTRALSSLEEGGCIELKLWPLFTSVAQDRTVEVDLEEAAYCLAVLVNQKSSLANSGGGNSSVGDGGALSFVTEPFKNEDDETDDTSSIRAKAFELLLGNLLAYKASKKAKRSVEVLTTQVRFLIALQASTSQTTKEYIHPTLLQIVGIGLWKAMPSRIRDLELKRTAAFRRHWGIYYSQAKKDNKDEVLVLEGFIPNLISQTLITLNDLDFKIEERVNEKEEEETNTNDQTTSLNLVHATLELLIDLLSTTTTRRYLRPYLLSINFSIKCTLSSLYRHPKTTSHRLFCQLLVMYQELETFGMNDITAAPLSSYEMSSLYHGRAHMLQKLSHRHYREELTELIHAGVGMVCNKDFLKRQLNKIQKKDILVDLCYRLRLVQWDHESFLTWYGEDKEGDGDESKRVKFAFSVLLYYFTLRPSELETLSSLPLYPDESLLWNPHLVPPGNLMIFSQLDQHSNTLALPKMSAQFLTFGDYLLRAFKLLRLESAYEIRGDIVDTVKRMRPVARQGYAIETFEEEEEAEDVMLWNKKRLMTDFKGWSRMALELTENATCPLELLKVSPPKLGERIPSDVIAELTIDLRHCGENIRNEWDSLREFDNLFLLVVDASSAEGGTAPLIQDRDDKHIPDEEDVTFYKRYGVTAVRGCMVLQVRDDNGTVISDPIFDQEEKRDTPTEKKGYKRILKVSLDPAQYAADATGKGSSYGIKVYSMVNVVMRRHGRENNFKAILETVRGLMKGTGSVNRSIPRWLRPVLLGYGDPASASFSSSNMISFAKNTVGVASPDTALDYGDTVLDEGHLLSSFIGSNMSIDGVVKKSNTPKGSSEARKKYRIKIVEESNTEQRKRKASFSTNVEATSYPMHDKIKGNTVRFTPVQVKAIRSGLSPGLTLIVGPPGTGKTDVAVQIISNLYHSFPTQRTVLVTHSNAALNDLFEKVMARGDIDERYMLRLGAGERDLQTDSEFDFTKIGRVNHILQRRGILLEKVQQLSESLGISGAAERGLDGSPSYTCETAEYFKRHHIEKRKQIFESKMKGKSECVIGEEFPFAVFFGMTETEKETLTIEGATRNLAEIMGVFDELAEYRPLELLRSQRQRTNYLLTKQARIVAMTCTHAAIARSYLVNIGFQYDNLLMEEAGQMLDIETFVPLLLQKGEADAGSARLKRVCLIGDHNQLPPVVKNRSFAKYSNLDQSLFTRLIRLGVPSIDLNKQGRARPELASLFSWRYKGLGNLDHVSTSQQFSRANSGFAHTYQMINVEDFEGRGESTPTAYFYQNMGEAEYAVALFQYMVLIGYPPERISILTTYNGQKGLLNDILSQRCGDGTPLAGIRPGSVSTVDHYQGQQNDYIILSLVRTKTVGHLRDVRRLVVAVSRARLGLYVICRQSVFEGCHELQKTIAQFLQRPNKLVLVTGEQYRTERSLDGTIPTASKYIVNDVSELGSIVHGLQQGCITE